LAIRWVTAHDDSRAVPELVLDLVHELLDQIHSAATFAVNVFPHGWIRELTGVKPGTGVFDDDEYSAALLNSHAHSHVLFGVAAIAMKDGVHERFLQSKLDIPQIVTTTIFFEQTKNPGNSAFNMASVRRNQFVQLDDQLILVELAPGRDVLQVRHSTGFSATTKNSTTAEELTQPSNVLSQRRIRLAALSSL